jgi:nickel superoxide dismutase
MRFLKKLFGILPLSHAHAHCDVPCGIYDPKPAQIAAATVMTMVQKINALERNGDDKQAKLNYKNSLMRMIWTKEEHARKCKEEILILWTDYFKPEHLEKFPGLHDTFWKTAKLCSKNKQEVSEKLAQELVESVNHIAEMFEQSQSFK